VRKGSTEVTVRGARLEVAVRESARARRLTVKVSADRPPEVVVPVGTGDREIERALRRHRDWIARKTEEMDRLAARRPRLGLDRPGVAWLHGEPLPIARGRGGRAVAKRSDGRLLVAGATTQASDAVERWYRREARLRISAVVEREAGALALRPGKISVRDPGSRWGSCSSQGNLSFSWRLLLPPREILEYVVIHELCHLRELNHSRAFWRLLDSARPGWRSEAEWLRLHGWELGRYRPRLAARAPLPGSPG
jgi:predicted metal-dependent hydrolase